MSWRENEVQRARVTVQLELSNLLVKKLIEKYGDDKTGMGINAHPVNMLIQAEVDLFMRNHDNIGKADLAQLERTVKKAARSDGCRGGGHKNSTRRLQLRPHTARSCSTSRSTIVRPKDEGEVKSKTLQRPGTAGSCTSSRTSRSRQSTPGGNTRRPWTGRSGCPGGSPNDDDRVPKDIKNEWLILEAYQQIQTEEKTAEEARKTQAGIRRCKEDLENQIAQNRVRAEKEREEKDMEKRELRQMVAEHAAYQEALKAEEKKKLLEERSIRASQILENERRRERERRRKQIDDDRILVECRQAVEADKQAQLKKRQKIAEILREMHRESEAKLLAREHQKLVDEEEDRRLVRECQEKLDRDQAERVDAHRRRMERYEQIGAHWTQKGAGKMEHDVQVTEEKRMLAEAAAKERADEQRERRDKEALRQDRARCLEDNKLLLAEKLARKQAEETEEAKYANHFRAEGEAYAAQGVNRKLETMRKQKAYAMDLQRQMRETKAARAAVEMTSREREMNGRTLRMLQENQVLREAISRRLLQKDPVRLKPLLFTNPPVATAAKQ